jgi:sodium-dependent dicarboxylate transporter 2/3/5
MWLKIQLLIILWMTRRISDDIPGWGVLFHGLVGDGSISVSISIKKFNNKVII